MITNIIIFLEFRVSRNFVFFKTNKFKVSIYNNKILYFYFSLFPLYSIIGYNNILKLL